MEEIKKNEIAVLIPCFNEEAAIADVIEAFQYSLPESTIYVYDNNSTDNTVNVAKKAGAIVRSEVAQGKGAVVRRMFADVEADIYVLVDGDGTYDAPSAPMMVKKLEDNNLDMLVGVRLSDSNPAKHFRIGHRLGNKLFTKLVGFLFGKHFSDILSGYRVFSRRFVKTFPAISNHFEIETELTVHALQLKLPCDDFVTPYYSRVKGSESKLSTFKDGYKILKSIVYFLKEHKPLLFFGTIALLLCVLSLILAIPIFLTYIKLGSVPRFPTAILATGIMLVSFISLSIGIIMDSVKLSHWEMKRIYYLSYRR